MTDSVHLLGNGSTPIAVLSTPSGERQSELAVIFFNSGLLHRVGPFRLYVDLSRRLTELGIPVVRIDQSGKGDSERRKGASFDEAVRSDFEDAATFLKNKVGAKKFIVIGLCSGADDGLYLSSRYPDVVGAVLLEPYAARTAKYYRRHYVPRLLRVTSWAAWVGRITRSLRARASSLARKTSGPVDMRALRAFPGHKEMRRRYMSAVERSAKLLCVFTDGSKRYYNYAGQLVESLGLGEGAGAITEIHLPWAKHTYPLVAHRQQLIDHVCAWMRSNFSVARDRKQDDAATPTSAAVARRLSLIEQMVERHAADFRSFRAHENSESLRQFQQELFGHDARQQNEQFARWLYLERPANELVYCEKNGGVVGTQGAIGFDFVVDGRTFRAAFAIDLRIRPEWKMKGLGVALIGNLLRKYDVVVGLGISDEAHSMFCRQGWLDLGATERWIRPVRARGLASTRNATLTRALTLSAGPVTWLLTVADALLDQVTPTRRGVQVQSIDRFGPEHDAALEKLRGNKLCAQRVSDYLNWRCFGTAVAGKYRVFAVSEHGEFKGYVATATGHRDGKRVLAISDLQCEKPYMAALLQACTRHARAEGVDAIYYQGINKDLQPLLRRFMFIQRDFGMRFMAFTRREELRELLKRREDWCISWADSDGDFSVLYATSSEQ